MAPRRKDAASSLSAVGVGGVASPPNTMRAAASARRSFVRVVVSSCAYCAGFGAGQNVLRFGSFQTSHALIGRAGHEHVLQNVPADPYRFAAAAAKSANARRAASVVGGVYASPGMLMRTGRIVTPRSADWRTRLSSCVHSVATPLTTTRSWRNRARYSP